MYLTIRNAANYLTTIASFLTGLTPQDVSFLFSYSYVTSMGSNESPVINPFFEKVKTESGFCKAKKSFVTKFPAHWVTKINLIRAAAKYFFYR